MNRPAPVTPTANDVQEQLLTRVAVLADVTIDPSEVAFAAGHWPSLLNRWLRHAYRIDALDVLITAYAEAIDVLRAGPLDQIDATTR